MWSSVTLILIMGVLCIPFDTVVTDTVCESLQETVGDVELEIERLQFLSYGQVVVVHVVVTIVKRMDEVYDFLWQFHTEIGFVLGCLLLCRRVWYHVRSL